jgi:hypothetical protein
MWNSSEWAAVAQASPKVQKPILQTALRDLRAGFSASLDIESRARCRCRVIYLCLKNYEGKGTNEWKEHQSIGDILQAFKLDIAGYIEEFPDGDIRNSLESLLTTLNSNVNKSGNWYTAFADSVLTKIINSIDCVFLTYPSDNSTQISSHEDMPVSFDLVALADYLEVIANQQGGNSNQFIAMMVMRIKAVLTDSRMKDVICPNEDVSLSNWLKSYIGEDGGSNGPVCVLDLSLVPYDILHLVVAVASRLIFESLQRYQKLNSKNLPTVIVLEEAHTFVAKKISNGEEIQSPAEMCRKIFERIAREGRKFGLGLVLSSQRPSELSETVLSQCNSFLLHRITNDRDQELISRLVPDNARGLLRELPSLPTRQCILLGIASKVPTLVEIKSLEAHQRPESDDPDFWDVWTNKVSRPISWDKIICDWTGPNDLAHQTGDD